MAKTFGYGTVLQVTTTTGDAAIAQLTNISGPGVDFAECDTTTMDSSSNFRTSVPGLGDPGDMSLSLMYDPAAVTHKRLAYYAGQRSVKAFKLYQGGSTAASEEDTFSAWVKSIGREIPMDNMITCDVTLHVTGKPGYTT